MPKVRRQTQIIRNDDVSADTTLEDIQWFSELCDKYGFRVLQCITVYGNTHPIDVRMSNEEIINLGGTSIFENVPVYNYLRKRKDLIAVHGLWHTHTPTEFEIVAAKTLLATMGLTPTYFVPPFNQGEYGAETCGLKVSALTQRLEDYLDDGTPTDDIIYLHSWRFGDWYPKHKLESCLKRITTLS